MRRLAELLGVARTVVRAAHEDDIRYPAAALAYHAFVSLVPLLLLVFAIVGRQFAIEFAADMPRFVTPAAQQLLYEALTAVSGRTGAVVLALAVLVWSGANVTVGFLTVVERVEKRPGGPLADRLRDMVVVLGALLLAMLMIVFTSVLVGQFSVSILGSVVGYSTLFVGLTVVFLPLYAIPSQVVPTFSAALPGAVTAATGWTLIHAAIQFFVTNATQYAVYGVLSGIIIILTSSYIAAVLLLLGVVVNATVTTNRSRTQRP